MARLLLFILFCGGTLREHSAFSPTPSFRRVTSLRALDVEESIETNAGGSPLVRRDYDTFLWKDHKINYRVEGEGDPILLVHGFGGNVNHFRFQFPALVEAGYQVYAIDLLGFGASDKPADAPYSIELFVELIVDFVTHMSAESKGQQWVLCGNSIGSLSALGAAEQLSDLVKAMVMFNCAGGMSMFRYEDVPFYLRPVLWLVQKVVLGPQLGPMYFSNFKTRENVFSILTEVGVYRDQTNVDDYLLELILGPSDDKGAEEVFLKVYAGPAGPTPETILPNLKIPILALWGDADPFTPMDQGMHPGTTLAKYSDQFTLVPIPGAGHCPHDECPDRVHEEMIPWLAKL